MDPHKSCTKCVQDREVKKSKDDGTFREPQTKILGVYKIFTKSRPIAKFIMYDGEGNYQKKLNQEHQNHKVQIDMSWKNIDKIDDQERRRKETNQTLESQSLILPKIYNHRQIEDFKPIKPILTSGHLHRYGKYSQRYLQKSDPMQVNENKPEDYLPTSEKYGRFYLSQEPKAKTVIPEIQPFEGYNPISPQYNIFPVEQPILTYHSMKSQLFKYKA